MNKKFKAVLSMMLAVVLILSLTVSAFADTGKDKDKDKKKITPVNVDLVIDLRIPDPSTVSMHELEDEDILLEGISFRPYINNGKFSIYLLDMACAKLLRESKDEAKELGLDYDTLYIKNGGIHVKRDAGLTDVELVKAEEALLKLLYNKSVPVNVGDVFEVANWDKDEKEAVVAIKLRVTGFIYPQEARYAIKQVDETDMHVKDSKNFETNRKDDGSYDAIRAKTPTATTIYFNYTPAVEQYDESGKKETKNPSASVGIAKDAEDTNTYYIQVNYDGDKKDTNAYKEMTDLTSTKDKKSLLDAFVNLIDMTRGLAKNFKIATDKDGKNVVRDVDVSNETPEKLEEVKKDKDFKAIEVNEESQTSTNYIPESFVEVAKDDGKEAEVELRDQVVKINCVHDYGSNVAQVKEATCTGDGLWTNTCTKCGTVEIVIPKHHEFSDDCVEKKEATCTEDGKEVLHCTKCNTDITTVIPALGHAWNRESPESTEAATCTKAGKVVYKCGDCAEKLTETIAMLEHSYVEGVCSCGAKDPNYKAPTTTGTEGTGSEGSGSEGSGSEGSGSDEAE